MRRNQGGTADRARRCHLEDAPGFNRTTGIPIVSIWTTYGPIAEAKRALADVVVAQDAHFRTHSRYLVSLEGVPAATASKGIRITVETHDKGWIARASIHRLFATCIVYDGVVPNLRVKEARNPECVEE